MDPAGLNNIASLWAPAVLRACWQGALAVGVVWLLCKLLPRLSPALRATLWWLACAKVVLGLFAVPLLPVAVLPAESTDSTVSTIPTKTAVVSADFYTEPAAISYDSQPVLTAPMPPAPAKPEPPSPLTLLFLFWSCGVLVLLLLAWRGNRRIQQQIADARPCADLELLSALVATEGLRHVPTVLVSESLSGSLVVGLWKPRIVLARADLADLEQEEKWALLAHELAHIRRGDLWLGMLPNLARTLFFFHPFVWLACREYELAREAACDAESLRVSGMRPADYGRLLLKLSLPPVGPALRPGVAALGVASPHARILLRRLQGLQKLKAEGGLPQWCSLLVLALVGVLLSLTPTRARIRTLMSPPSYAPVQPEGQIVVKVSEIPQTVRAAAAPYQADSTVLPPMTEAVQEVSASLDVKGTQSEMKLSVRPVQKLTRAVTAAAAMATVGAPAMLSSRAANAQETPPTPAVPPLPAVAAVAAPVAPAAPEAPVLTALQARKYQYTLRTGKSYSTHVSDGGVATGQRKLAEAQPGDCLIVDRDGKRYLITDAATLRQVKENYAAVEAKGKQMELKGKEMEKISVPMEALGKQMEALGKIMEAHGKEMGILGEKMGTASEAERAALHEQMKALQAQMRVPGDEMRALGKKMRDQGDKMRIPGDEMREMGKQMRAAVKEAEERMTRILDDAFKNNLAVEQAGSVSSAAVEIPLD